MSTVTSPHSGARRRVPASERRDELLVRASRSPRSPELSHDDDTSARAPPVHFFAALRGKALISRRLRCFWLSDEIERVGSAHVARQSRKLNRGTDDPAVLLNVGPDLQPARIADVQPEFAILIAPGDGN